MADQLWARLGATLLIEDGELEILKAGGDDAEKLLKRIVKEDRFFLDGETYVPEGYYDQAHDEYCGEITIDVSDDFVRAGKWKYEVVDEIPAGYRIWNIGDHGPFGYVPLCKLKVNQPPDGREVDSTSLKAILSDGAFLIMEAVSRGGKTLGYMKRYVEENRDTTSFIVKQKVFLYQNAIPYMEKLKGVERLEGDL